MAMKLLVGVCDPCFSALGFGLRPLIEKIALGNGGTCALLSNKKLWCWGHNNYGQLGNGIVGVCSYDPVPVSFDGSVVEVNAAYSHSCLIDVDLSLWRWGLGVLGSWGQDYPLTSGGTPTIDSATPVLTYC